jgi:hypothetical protein
VDVRLNVFLACTRDKVVARGLDILVDCLYRADRYAGEAAEATAQVTVHASEVSPEQPSASVTVLARVEHARD